MKGWRFEHWAIATAIVVLAALGAFTLFGPQSTVTVRLDFPPPAKDAAR